MSQLKYDALFTVKNNGVHGCIYTDGDEPRFEMSFESVTHVELFIANIQRELLLAQVRDVESKVFNTKIKELEDRLFSKTKP